MLLLCFWGMTIPAFAQNKILYVMRMEYKDREVDEKVKHYLDSLGYSVTFADESEPASKAAGFDLVIISATVSSQKLAGKYADVKTPLLMWENDILDDMRYTSKYKGVDFGEVEKEHYLWMVNAPHPLSAGVPAGMAVAYPRDQPMGWGKPGLGASIIATLPGQPDKAVIFGYEKGATMDYDYLAPARRVYFFLDNITFPLLTPTGKRLFEAAVKWTIGK
jgi:hypothetical protein